MEQVGAITYLVDMDTAAVTKGADRVNAALDSVGKGANRLDGTMSKAERTVTQTAKASAKAANDVGRLEKATESASNAAGGFAARLTPLAAAIGGLVTAQAIFDLGKMAEQFTLLQARITRLSADSETAAITYNRLLTVAAATGQTMPETVKLWETLTSSLKSLGATNDQVITLTSTLQKIGKIGGSSADETANALRQLGQSLAAGTLRAEEFNSIVEQTPELVRQLAAASGRSMGEFRQAMLDGKVTSQELFDLLMGRTQAVDAEFQKLPRSVADAANAVVVQMGAAASAIDQATSASKALAFILDRIADGIQVTFNPTDVQKFNTLLRDRSQAESVYQAQLQNGSKRSQEAAKKRLDSLNAEIKAMQDARIEAIKAQNGGGGTSTSKPAPTTTEDGQKAIEQLAQQNQQLRAEGIERAKIIALQKLGASATQQEKDAAVALAVENYNLQEAEKARNKASSEGAAQRKRDEAAAAAAVRKENEEAQRGYQANQKVIQGLALELANAALKGEELAVAQAKAKLNKFASPEDVAEVERLTRAIVQQQQIIANKQLAGQVDPMVGAQQNLEKQLADIATVEQAQLISTTRANELRLAAETTYQEQVRALQEETFRQASVGNDLLIGTLNSLQQASSQAFVGLVTGATDGRTAVQQLAGAILNQGVNALLEMGFAQVKSIVMGQAAQATATAAGVGQAATLTSAYTPAAAAASVASFGGAAVAGLAAMASAVPAMMGLFGGGRQYGGPVDGSKMYRVNEGGAPEIFNAAGGKQYMMPNTRGEVVSNKDATSTGAAPQYNVNIIESSDRGGQVEQNNNGGLDVFVAQIRNGGEAAKTLESTYGLKRVGR